MIYLKTNVPLESNRGVPVNIQDQTTRPIILNFNKISNSTTLTVAAVKGEKTITIDNVTGFADGKYIILFDPLSLNFSFYSQVGAVSGNVVTLDTPIDYSYPSGTNVDVGITDMSVDGSTTTHTFGLRGAGSPPGVDVMVDITRIIFYCIADSVVDLSLFANIPKLSKGIVLRKRNDTIQNIFNIKSNADLAGLMYDFNVSQQINPVQGEDGFIARMTFAGQEKIGVAIRLPVGDDLEFLIQDDLTDITSLKVVAEGHIVLN